jgi:ribA/ribD-fused uncharacterized protein
MAWHSCQQYWLAQKFLDPNRKEAIHHSKTLEEAQALAEQWALRQDWDDVKDSYLQLATHAKFAEHLHLHFLLADTDDAELIYADPNDPDWVTGPDGKGQNKLGKLLMELRRGFQEIQNDAIGLGANPARIKINKECIRTLNVPFFSRLFFERPAAFSAKLVVWGLDFCAAMGAGVVSRRGALVRANALN